MDQLAKDDMYQSSNISFPLEIFLRDIRKGN